MFVNFFFYRFRTGSNWFQCTGSIQNANILECTVHVWSLKKKFKDVKQYFRFSFDWFFFGERRTLLHHIVFFSHSMLMVCSYKKIWCKCGTEIHLRFFIDCNDFDSEICWKCHSRHQIICISRHMCYWANSYVRLSIVLVNARINSNLRWSHSTNTVLW